jgi:hypothetical protein
MPLTTAQAKKATKLRNTEAKLGKKGTRMQGASPSKPQANAPKVKTDRMKLR